MILIIYKFSCIILRFISNSRSGFDLERCHSWIRLNMAESKVGKNCRDWNFKRRKRKTKKSENGSERENIRQQGDNMQIKIVYQK